MPALKDASARHRWLETFSEHKDALEVQLMRILSRAGTEPSASVVAVTDAELAFDIHKDGHRQFFTANTFRDLNTDTETTGIPGAGGATTDRFVASGLAFTQKIRNEHFAVSANGTPRLYAYEGPDPLPKRIMRAAAMAARAAGLTDGPGAEHDVQEGLDLLSNRLYNIRDSAPEYSQLQDLVSVRRGARGKYRLVEPTHQLLLAELIFDIASSGGASRPGTSQGSDVSVPIDDRDVAIGSEPKTTEAPKTSDVQVKEAAPPAKRAAMPFGSTTAFFAERFASSFPGVRSTAWYDDPGEIATRLLMLLKAPLSFSDGIPIWWWRGRNLQIERFERRGPNEFIMNTEELKITRIAAVPGSTYQRNFVYVQTDAMAPTGLYPEWHARSAEHIEQSGYHYEEYGLFEGNHLLKREEYDDGYAMIDGNLVKTSGRSELRVRYITPYNFLIAAQGSPINNPQFDQELEQTLNAALKGNAEEAVENILGRVNALPLRESRSV